MHTPAPPSTAPASPGRTHHPTGSPGDDETVLLNTRAIDRAASPRAWPAPPVYPSSPGPHDPVSRDGSVPAGARPDATRGPAPVETASRTTNDRDDDKGPTFSLTATQVVASMSAAVVAAFIGAQLGVAGTIVGAAIASVVSVVGSAVIGHSLLLTRRRVTMTVQHARAGAGSPADDQQTVLLTAVTRKIELAHAAASAAPTPDLRPASPPSARPGRWSRPRRLRGVLVGLAASVAVFAGALGAVTVVEAVTGAPISGGSSGFSVTGGGRGGEGTTGPAADPAVNSTVDPTADSTGDSTVDSTVDSTGNSTDYSTAGQTTAAGTSTGGSTESTSPAPSTASTAPSTSPAPSGTGGPTTATAVPGVAAATGAPAAG